MKYQDLISALNAADKRPCSDLECPGSGECPTVGCLFREAADAIEELQTQIINKKADANNDAYDVGYYAGRRDYEPKWIPVKERLPEPKFAREWYLVHLESGCIKTLAFEKSGTPNNLFKDGWHETASRITHWMPLPEPPKEKTE